MSNAGMKHLHNFLRHNFQLKTAQVDDVMEMHFPARLKAGSEETAGEAL